jgi:hypothetical protein
MTEPIDPNTLSPGTIRRGPEIGRSGQSNYVVNQCRDCGEHRWVQNLLTNAPRRCAACHRKFGKYNAWIGG